MYDDDIVIVHAHNIHDHIIIRCMKYSARDATSLLYIAPYYLLYYSLSTLGNSYNYV